MVAAGSPPPLCYRSMDGALKHMEHMDGGYGAYGAYEWST